MPPHGAVLALRVRGAPEGELLRYRGELLRRYRQVLVTSASLPAFLARLLVWTLGGNRGVRSAMRIKRKLTGLLRP